MCDYQKVREKSQNVIFGVLPTVSYSFFGQFMDTLPGSFDMVDWIVCWCNKKEQVET